MLRGAVASHLRKLEGHLRGHFLRGDIVLLLVQEVLDALLVDLDFHLFPGEAAHRKSQHSTNIHDTAPVVTRESAMNAGHCALKLCVVRRALPCRCRIVRPPLSPSSLGFIYNYYLATRLLYSRRVRPVG